jgi:hypothetical protein
MCRCGLNPLKDVQSRASISQCYLTPLPIAKVISRVDGRWMSGSRTPVE